MRYPPRFVGIRPSLWPFFWVLFFASTGCASRTAVIVVVESDLPDVAAVRATVGEGVACDGSCVHDFVTTGSGAFPFSFVVEPRTDPSSAFSLAVIARDAGGASLVEQHIDTRFLAGRTVRLRVRLSAACRGVSCTASDRCEVGVCVARLVDPSTLPDVVPGREFEGLDAGSPSDVGLDVAIDAPLIDAPEIDAPIDAPASSLPRSCAELPRAAPTGLTSIDPDGPGGEAPFDAWCENVADGGGWTLIAKVDPNSPTLAFEADAWLAPLTAPIVIGTPDTSRVDALLLPYWRVEVGELRVGADAAWLITGPVTPARGVLRVGIESSVALDATADDWAAVVGSAVHSGTCQRSGFSVLLPDVGPPEVAVRIGLVGSSAADCSAPTYWYGVGASVRTSRAACTETTNTAGAGRVCNPMRRAVPQFLFVYGR